MKSTPAHLSYDSDILGGALMVRESRIIADLLLTDAGEDTWHRAIYRENRLQKPSQATARRITRAIDRRLRPLPSAFWKALRDSDEPEATQIAFCACLSRNLLFLEFVETIVTDALLTRVEVLEPYQWRDFLAERADRYPKIKDWSASSQRKMGQIVFRMLSEAGLIDSTRTRRLRPQPLLPEVERLLQACGMHRVRRCLRRLGPTN
ncbi:DUF1819 family protein [Thioalkalivibrio sp. ALE11]|uniref:DUF1819 family protein n=1 Tax=Thioalkalivibrio sp. ALE11 TaxID=1265494 RepID=UPI000477DCF4|nr:DUF1819 family protein [Thioalkalivibrio sp. ALE11]